MENQIAQQRDLSVIESEINILTSQAQSMALHYIFEIGKRLAEAKALVPHGGWSEWLSEKVNYSQRTASNYIKLYEEYGSGQIDLFSNSQPVANLDYSKALALLAVPRDERAEFIEENDVEHISKREVEKLIKERDEALKQAEQAQELQDEIDTANERVSKAELDAAAKSQKVTELEQQLKKAQEDTKKAKDKLKELKANPVIPQEKLDELAKAAQEKAAEESAHQLEEKTAELNEKLKTAQAEREAAQTEKVKAAEKAAELEKKLLLSSPEVTEFNFVFKQLQTDFEKLIELIDTIGKSNPEVAQKFRKGLDMVITNYQS